MNVVVIGGGFIGQLVQLIYPEARLLDWRKTPPKHHLDTRVGPQYLWEPIRWDGVVSESFTVRTTIDGLAPCPESILAYKRKIGKEHDGGNWGLQFQPETVGWSSALPKPRVEYGRTVRMVDLPGHMLGMEDFSTITYDILINTIPLPSFLAMMIVGPETSKPFESMPIYMLKEEGTQYAKGEMLLNYISRSDDIYYRETRTGTIRYYETLIPLHALPHLKIKPGKILPHADSEMIVNALRTYQCHSFGRFATWRPDELAHESWQEILKWKEIVEL